MRIYMYTLTRGRAFGGLLDERALRLKIGLSSSELVENDQSFVRNAMVLTRMSGFEDAPV
eukprot:9368846-Heterocapsa_arctica.AAC.1